VTTYSAAPVARLSAVPSRSAFDVDLPITDEYRDRGLEAVHGLVPARVGVNGITACPHTPLDSRPPPPPVSSRWASNSAPDPSSYVIVRPSWAGEDGSVNTMADRLLDRAKHCYPRLPPRESPAETANISTAWPTQYAHSTGCSRHCGRLHRFGFL
jgi:hypothetical protein